MKYPGKEILLGDVVEFVGLTGRWRVEVLDDLNGVAELVSLTPGRVSLAARPERLKLISRAPKPARPPRLKRRRRLGHDPSDRSVALNVGGHLGVTVVADPNDDPEDA